MIYVNDTYSILSLCIVTVNDHLLPQYTRPRTRPRGLCMSVPIYLHLVFFHVNLVSQVFLSFFATLRKESCYKRHMLFMSWNGCPSCHQTSSVRTLKQSIDPNQWLGLSFLPPLPDCWWKRH